MIRKRYFVRGALIDQGGEFHYYESHEQQGLGREVEGAPSGVRTKAALERGNREAFRRAVRGNTYERKILELLATGDEELLGYLDKYYPASDQSQAGGESTDPGFEPKNAVGETGKDKPRSVRDSKTLKDLFPHIPEDAIVHFSPARNLQSLSEHGVTPNEFGYSHWLKFSQISGFNLKQVSSIIGNLANDDIGLLCIADVKNAKGVFSEFGLVPGANSAIVDLQARKPVPVKIEKIAPFQE